MNTYTREEVAKHCTKESCWIVVGRNVYDLTNYMAQHPPGPGMILSLAQKGRDAKGMYSIHSAKAKEMWESLKIGTLSD